MTDASTLRVLQVTDCHVSARAGTDYRGLDARLEFERLLPAAHDWAPDLVLLTGDVAEDGSAEACAWVAERLVGLGVPVLATPGNHDLDAVIAAQFPLSATASPLVHDRGDWRLVLLNSARPGKIDGHLGDDDLQTLAGALDEWTGHALVALHHQPLDVGSPWIDRYPLQAPENLWRVLDGSCCRVVCWGHVHQAFEARVGQVRALSGPSTAANSLPGREKFTLDPAGPACRGLVLRRDGAVESEILRAGT
ncbi:hypothetical protein F3N42_09775 [Marinihelvus fidelis]|uniref:Calcineurin-like phosphoesterase domain-containing protein n=1 Tax=Marinihelvus fidelis TaxID=2613842 RepID=A0A5N0TAY6_9GAMM|nr:metallophosphoesterase [Marinihelvus fidelis]KAA9131594.1 hypothetical protein F3N42_09775 [Marinihelvus fidelis]